jgi:hypothetical protein
MKPSDLIKTLQEYIAAHGDDEIEFSNESEGTSMEVREIVSTESDDVVNGRFSGTKTRRCEIRFY